MHRDRGTPLYVVHPQALPEARAGRQDGWEHRAVALLVRLAAGEPVQCLAGRVTALYRASDRPSSGLAEVLADHLWLRPQLLVPDALPSLHWAGVLDQLGRQHAGGAVIVVAPRTRIGPALEHLVCSGRAWAHATAPVAPGPRAATPGAPGPGAALDGLCELRLEDGRDAAQLPRPDDPRRCPHDPCRRPDTEPTPVRPPPGSRGHARRHHPRRG